MVQTVCMQILKCGVRPSFHFGFIHPTICNHWSSLNNHHLCWAAWVSLIRSISIINESHYFCWAALCAALTPHNNTGLHLFALLHRLNWIFQTPLQWLSQYVYRSSSLSICHVSFLFFNQQQTLLTDFWRSNRMWFEESKHTVWLSIVCCCFCLQAAWSWMWIWGLLCEVNGV